jgi:hypothetical protein
MKRCGLKINVYRVTEAYMPIKKAQDRFWPAKVNVDQPLTAIMDNNSYTMYNFCFGDKVLSKYKIEGKVIELKIERPLNIRRVVLWFYQQNALLRGI